MAKLPPDGNSTVVSVRRTESAGSVRPPTAWPELLTPPLRVKAPVLVSSLTSVEICSEIRPSLSTTGVKANPTPNGLYSTVMLPDRSCDIGTGNSPPARNFAGSPEIAVRFGSASECTSPIRSSACITPVTLLGAGLQDTLGGKEQPVF